MDILKEQYIDAARKYLEKCGHEVLAKNVSEKVDLVTDDPRGELHFIHVKGIKRPPKEKDQKVSSKLRTKMEQGMLRFICENGDKYVDNIIHIDRILIYPTDSGRQAFLIYVKDCTK